ncbi:MAG: electron transport complex subunit RsxC [Eubacteriales bacterium]|nr:electron transport complex subunit RsxC [Eubacteriales bacterium]
MANTFLGGIHPRYSKELTKSIPLQEVIPGETVTILMQQHIGVPCKPLVKVGDKVLVGQKIGDSDAFLSVPVHSTVSGTVKKIARVIQPNGNKGEAVIIQNDGNFERVWMETKPLEELSKEEILHLIREAGIVGLGGAGFPTHIKLNPPADKKIEYILINGAECEPYLTSDHRIMLEKPDALIRGLRVLLKLFPDAQGIIGIEDNKPDAIEAIANEIKGFDRMSICVMETKYPQGAEKQLIYSATKRIVPSGKLPADIGCIVDNVDTTVAIGRAIFKGGPLLRRIITLSGDKFDKPMNLSVPLGISYRQIIEMAGGHPEDAVKIINGGPMMGLAMFDYDVPVMKTSSCILLLSEREASICEESACIRCGRCTRACPMNLLPLELDRFARFNDEDRFVRYHGLDCIECGSCSYVCPAKRHLVHAIRVKKRAIMAKKKG